MTSIFLFVLRDEPFFVVTRITPLRPCSPYNVVALSPFTTFMLSILFGSRSKKRLDVEVPPPYWKLPWALLLASKGTPSTMKSGVVPPPLIVLTPLIVMFVPLPDIPLVFSTSSPGTLPFRTRPISPSDLSSRSFLSTVETA